LFFKRSKHADIRKWVKQTLHFIRNTMKRLGDSEPDKIFWAELGPNDAKFWYRPRDVAALRSIDDILADIGKPFIFAGKIPEDSDIYEFEIQKRRVKKNISL